RMHLVELIALRCKCGISARTLCRPDDPRLGPFARCGWCHKPFVRDLANGFGSREWNACTDGARLREVLGLLCVPITTRKMRLGACYVCRTTFEWCRNPRFLEAVAVGEAFADGECAERDRQAAYNWLREVPWLRGQSWHPEWQE